MREQYFAELRQGSSQGCTCSESAVLFSESQASWVQESRGGKGSGTIHNNRLWFTCKICFFCLWPLLYWPRNLDAKRENVSTDRQNNGCIEWEVKTAAGHFGTLIPVNWHKGLQVVQGHWYLSRRNCTHFFSMVGTHSVNSMSSIYFAVRWVSWLQAMLCMCHCWWARHSVSVQRKSPQQRQGKYV